MKISNAVVLALVVGSIQLQPPVSGANNRNRILEYFANYTSPAIGLDATKNFTAFAGDLPPPVPQVPNPRPPGDLALPLFASASDEVWEKAKCKGANFVRAMRGSDREAGATFNPVRASAAGQFEKLGKFASGWISELRS